VAAARSNQALQSGSAATAAANAAGNYAGLLAVAGEARAQHGGEVHGQLANRAQNQRYQLSQAIAQARSDKGPAFVKNLTGLRQSQFENRVTIAGLDLKQADLEASSAKDAADRRLAEKRIKQADDASRRSAGTTRRGQDITHGDKVADRNAKTDPAKKKVKEPQSSINTRAAIVTVQGEYEGLLRRFGGDHAKTAKTLRSRARKAGQTLPEYVLVAAADLANFGYVTPGHVRALRNAGVRVPKGWRTRSRPASRTGATGNSDGRRPT
jgi:hypothetical protein